MAFFLRRPFAVTSALGQVPKAANTARFIHNSPLKKPQSSKPLGSISSSVFARSRQGFQNAFKRTYVQPTYGASQGNMSQRLLYGAAIVGGTIMATNFVFNRETREDGTMPPFERSYLNETFIHTGLGVGIIGIAARALHMNGWSYRLMATNPWAVIGLGLVASMGTMFGTFYTPPEK